MMLEELRKEIDEYDTDLIHALSKRMKTVEKVSEYKKKHNLEVGDEQREEKILESRKKLAEELGVSKELVEELFLKIMEYSRKAQKK